MVSFSIILDSSCVFGAYIDLKILAISLVQMQKLLSNERAFLTSTGN
jgi:hypothetical protein